MILTAGYLPGLSPDEVEWQTLTFNRSGEQTEVSVPLLSDHQIKELSSNIKKASRHYLKALPVSEILITIDRAICQFLDRSNPYRQQAEKYLPRITGYDSEMVRLGLTGYLKTLSAVGTPPFSLRRFLEPKNTR